MVLLQKYHDLDVEVTRKDGLILIREMAAEVKNMMDIKMSAVMVSTTVPICLCTVTSSLTYWLITMDMMYSLCIKNV